MNQDLPKLHVVAPTLMTNPVFPEKEKEEKKNKKEASSMTKLEFTAWYFVPAIYIIFTVSYFSTCTLL